MITESKTTPIGDPRFLHSTNSISEANGRKGALILACLFFLLYLPSLPSLSTWRGDERFYTDAAIRMEQSGDYLTPVYPNGDLRFKKPILPYWAVLSGIKVFGFNYLGSRFAFLVAGALVIWLSFEICRVLTRRPDLSLIATAVVASNLTMHNTSIRSTPDMLLCLFALISLIGFSNLLFNERKSHWFAMAYLGSGLAIATKGLSGLLPVLYAFIYAAFSKRPDIRIRSLLHPVFIPLALAVGSSWFIWAFSRHGTLATTDFFGDQVGERFSGTKTYILANAGVYLSSFITQLLPWTLLALMVVAVRYRAVRESMREYRTPLMFAAGWILFLFIIFSFGNIQRTRYFLPAYPFLALFFAFPLLRGMNDSSRILNHALRVLFAFAILSGAVLTVFGIVCDLSNLTVAGIVLAGVASLVMRMSASWVPPSRISGAAVIIILALSVNDLWIVPVFKDSTAPEITRKLLAGAPERLTLPMAGMDVREASQIRLLSAGRLDTLIVRPENWDSALRKHGLLICTERVLNRWQPTNAISTPLTTASGEWKFRDYVELFRTTNRPAFLKSKRVPYYLVSNASESIVSERADPPTVSVSE